MVSIETTAPRGLAPGAELEPGRRPGPFCWATIEEIPEIFERHPDEFENDFFVRVADRAQRLTSQCAELSVITAYASKPEPPATGVI